MSPPTSTPASAKPDLVRPALIYDRLVIVGACFAAAVVLHNSDHVRRGARAVDAEVFWLGAAAIVLEVGLVVLICQRHRLAPLAAAVSGVGLAAGYVFVHFLPERQWLSDPLIAEGGVSNWSVFVALIETAAAVALAVAGFKALSLLRGLDAPAGGDPQQRRLQEALVHPLAVAFAASQVVILAISFAQL